MSTGTSLAAAIETVLNLHLARSPRARQLCSMLEGKVIALDITGLNLSVYFLPHGEGIEVLGHYEGETDARLSGSPLGFARLARSGGEDALFEGAVNIQGDTEIARQFQDILSHSDWDWEEQLSRLTGDVFAHQTGKLVDRVRGYARNGHDTLQQNISEYLQEEARLLPPRIEMKYFLEAVDELRADTDRLAARVRRLLQTPDSEA